MLKEAGAVIVVCGDLDVNKYEYVHVDCAAAVQNILLEAEHLGIGACWCAASPREELCRGFARKNVSELQKLTAKLDDKYLLELAEEKMQDALKLSKEQYSDLYMRAV